MSGLAVTFLLVMTVALLRAPRKWAMLPLLAGACYMTLGQRLELGPFTFTPLRILLAAGVIRVMSRRERVAGGLVFTDVLMLIWAGWAAFSSQFHEEPDQALIFRLGMVYDACGVFFLTRVFCGERADVIRLSKIIAILLVPVAVEMLFEQLTVHNLFSVLGGVPDCPAIREGRVRAQGPFAHAILAGTVGGSCLPMLVGSLGEQRRTALLGIVACCVMVVASASSGPILTAVAGMAFLSLWYLRDRMHQIWWMVVLAYCALDLVMKAPAYYIIARIDLTGGSTGWHRAALIESAIKHIEEWWFIGTDYTRHWMPSGVSWNEYQTDITNYYIHLGVIGGLPLMVLFFVILVKAFRHIGPVVNEVLEPQSGCGQFPVWGMAASLGAIAVTGISVSFFDQSFLFLYMPLAICTSLGAVHRKGLL